MSKRAASRAAGFVTVLALAVGLGTAAPRSAAAIDPCFGYDLCVHVSVRELGEAVDNGSGVVTSTPAGIHCNFLEGGAQTATSTCDWYFHKNFVTSMTIELDAVADSDNTVLCDPHVAPGASCSRADVFTASQAFTPTFEFRHNPITVHIGNAGKPGGFVYSTPMGIDCGEQYAGCMASWPYEASIQLYAEGDNGGVFQSWTGTCAGNDVSCDLILRQDIDTTAIFGNPATPTPKPTVEPSIAPGETPRATWPGATAHPASPAATFGSPGATPLAEPSAVTSTGAPKASAAEASIANAPATVVPAASEAASAVPVGTSTPFDATPLVIAIIVAGGLIAIGIVAAAAMARRRT